MTTGTIHRGPTSPPSTNANTIGIVSSPCTGNRYGWHENSPWPTPDCTTPAVETLLVEPLAATRSAQQFSPYSVVQAGDFDRSGFINQGSWPFGQLNNHHSHSSSGSELTAGGPFTHHLSKRSVESRSDLGDSSSQNSTDMAMLFPWTYYFGNQFPSLLREKKSVIDSVETVDDAFVDEIWPYQNFKNVTALYNELGSGEAIENVTESAVNGDISAWEFNLYMHGVVMPLIAIFGVLANVASLVVLTRHAMRSSVINIYLAALSAFDGLLLLIALLLYPPMSYCEWYGSDSDASSSWCRYFFHSSLITYPVSLIAQSGSVYTLVAITIDRFIAITWPLASRKWMTNQRALIVVAITVLWSIIYNIPAFFELRLIEQPVEFVNDQPVAYVTIIDRTELRKDSSYVRAYKGYCYLIFMLLLPAGAMILLNFYITISVRRASRLRRENMNVSASRDDKERRCTVMAVLVVGTFLILNSLAFINNMLEGFWSEEKLTTSSFLTLVCIGNTMVALNSATNFFIYCALGLRFRQMFCKLFCPWCYTPEREYQYLSVYYGSGRNYCWTNGTGRETGDPASATLLGGGIISMRTLSSKNPIDRVAGKSGPKSTISPPTLAPPATDRRTGGSPRSTTVLTQSGTRISSPVSAPAVRPQNVRFDLSQRL